MIYIKTNNELYHHGIQGQKWGKRNGPPYPLGYSKHSKAEKEAMSKDEKYRAKAVDRASYHYGVVADRYDRLANSKIRKRSKMEDKYYKKLDKYESSGNEAKIDKLTNRFNKKYDKVSDQIGLANIGKELCNNLLEKEIGHIQTMDIVEDKKQRGKDLAKDILLSVGMTSAVTFAANIAGAPVVALISRTTPESRLTKDEVKEAARYAGAGQGDKKVDRIFNDVVGRTTKYNPNSVLKSMDSRRVMEKNIKDPLPDKYSMEEQAKRASDRDDGKKVSSYYTSSEKKSKLETALKSDRYDLNFLEAIQNSKILIDGKKSAIDKQYEIYLDDPEAYWDKARKLPTY